MSAVSGCLDEAGDLDIRRFLVFRISTLAAAPSPWPILDDALMLCRRWASCRPITATTAPCTLSPALSNSIRRPR